MKKYYHYIAFGLNIQSPIELPATSIPKPSNVDVFIDFGKIDLDINTLGPKQGIFRASKNALFLDIEEVGQFLISKGKKITICPAENSDKATLRQFLLGSAFAGILHFRDYLTLHASAIEIEGYTSIFLGHSGHGKSTTAYALINEGYKALTDDISAIKFDSEEKPLVFPSFKRVKLWPDSLDQLHLNNKELPLVRKGIDKKVIFDPSNFNDSPKYLTNIFCLRPKATHKINIYPVTGTKKLKKINEYIYRKRILYDMKSQKDVIELAIKIALHANMYLIERPIDKFELRQLVHAILKYHK